MTGPTNGSSAPAPIECESAVRRLWDFLDGRLPAVARVEVETHLATCERCPPHFTFARAMQRALAVSSSSSAVADDEARLRERVRAALAQLRTTGDDSARR